jgi:hypothetical protein
LDKQKKATGFGRAGCGWREAGFGTGGRFGPVGEGTVQVAPGEATGLNLSSEPGCIITAGGTSGTRLGRGKKGPLSEIASRERPVLCGQRKLKTPGIRVRERGSWLGDDMSATVPLVAFLGLVSADRALLAIADHSKLRLGHAHGRKKILGGAGPAIAERHIVLVRTTLIAVPLDPKFLARIILENAPDYCDVILQSVRGIGPNRALVIIEQGVFQTSQPIVQSGSLLRGH